MKVAVLMGGLSKEREISFRSGRAVALALARKGHDVTEVDANGPEALFRLKETGVDSAFIALHGKFGEDGSVQGLLEWLGIPYTGPGIFSSSLCFDKIATKEFLAGRGIFLPPHAVYESSYDPDLWIGSLNMKYPLVVKPNKEGSSIGMKKAETAGDLREALDCALEFDSRILVEHFVKGREITVGVSNGKALPIVEVVPKNGLYDYEAKYTKGKTEYIVPARLDKGEAESIMKTSEKICGFLHCESAVRVDYILEDSGNPFFLEVNTIPGMTETSLLPKAACCAGTSFDDLCEEILKTARLKIGR